LLRAATVRRSRAAALREKSWLSIIADGSVR